MIEIKLTADTAQAVLWAMREHLKQRTPVREYVDTRYASHDEAFRNTKIGEVQERINRLKSFNDRLLTQVAMQPQGETK